MTKILPPLTYQGGKQRIASKILDIIQIKPDQNFYDLCCGSGAVSIELINRGHPPDKIIMLDKSPWGLFWQSISKKTFDLEKFEWYISKLPKNLSKIKDHLKTLSKEKVNEDSVYIFLILQAGSFGGKAIWIENENWKTHGFRSYWLPTKTSNRRHPVNPMMPMPNTLLERVKNICTNIEGIKGIYDDINNFNPKKNGVMYIDPPYENTTFYGYNFNIKEYIGNTTNKCFVSEGKSLSKISYLISSGRKKGGISGKRGLSPHEEWLSEFN